MHGSSNPGDESAPGAGIVTALAAKMLLVGPVMVGLGLWGLVSGLRSSRWPATIGAVTTCFCDETTKPDGEVEHRLKLRYTYRVNAIDREGRRVRISFSEESPEWIHDRVARYPAGGEVTVRYDPGDPDSALLEPGFAGSSLFFLAMGIGSCVGGVMILYDRHFKKAAHKGESA